MGRETRGNSKTKGLTPVMPALFQSLANMPSYLGKQPCEVAMLLLEKLMSRHLGGFPMITQQVTELEFESSPCELQSPFP